MFSRLALRTAVRPLNSPVLLQVRCYSAAPSEGAHARLTHEGPISYLTLDRPKAKNALSMRLISDFRAAVDECRFNGTTRALIINSSSSVFCAGADLKERRGMSQLQVAEFLYKLRAMLGELDALPVPTIAALDGAALGGGLELALACDLRVASNAASKIGLPETRLAVMPGAGGTQRLTRLIGVSRAKDLIFTSKVMTAAEAHNIGIVNYLADEGQTATQRAEVLVGEILKAGPLALGAAKLAIDVGSQMDLESGLDIEATAYKTILKSEDRLEGLRAFAEKRAPVYKGE